MADLNPKQLAFVREYAIDLNATQAAIRAGYSEKTAYSQGQRLLRHVEVQRLIRETQSARAQAQDITAERVLEKLGMIAFGATDDTPKTADQVKALGLLARYLGMDAPQKVEVTGKDGQPIEIAGRDPSTMSSAEIRAELAELAAKLDGEPRKALAGGDSAEGESE